MRGKFFSIEEFSVYDGPGIRTSVFLKGCPLRCSWCHNPEGQNLASEIVRSPNGCIGCGRCERLAERCGDRTVFTEESIKNCPMNLLRVCGEEIGHEELVEKLLKNAAVLKMNGGGVTFSGGEPLMQHEFLTECIDSLQGRLHVAVQTSGYADPEVFRSILRRADFFLYDLKIIDEGEHLRHTGVSNKRIIENFKTLSDSGVDFVVRVPLIPGVTDTEENIRGICELMAECGVYYAELLPYNKMAGGKYKMLMREYTPTFDSTRECSVREHVFSQYGINIKVL